ANSFWNDFRALNQYATRVQSFMQAGKPANDVLLYFGIADYWSESADNGQLLRSFHSNHLFDEVTLGTCGNFLTEQGYAWDAISDQQLLGVTCRENTLYTGGNAYK